MELAPGWNGRLGRLVPFAFAVATGYQVLKYLVVQPAGIGFDARLYLAASRAWLAGQNPWQVSDLGIYYGAPPPTLLAFAPLTILPEQVAMWLVIAGSFALAALAFRSLGMPPWWLIAWPVVDASLVGNPDVALLAVLALNRGRLSWLAPLLKIYAFAPLVAERRFRHVSVAVGLLIATALVLPWQSWFVQLPTIATRLSSVSDTTSVYGNPILMGVGVIALLALGLRRAGWLSVPVLWPSTQPHYLAMSLPALSPWLAIAWCAPHPLIVLGSVVVEAITRTLQRRRSSAQMEPST